MPKYLSRSYFLRNIAQNYGLKALLSTVLVSCMAQDLTVEKYRKKLQYYLQKDAEVAHFIQINEQGIYLFESKEAKEKMQAEFLLAWNRLPAFQKIIHTNPDKAWQIYNENDWQLLTPSDTLTSTKRKAMVAKSTTLPLAGIRIALDAGHFASNLTEAKIEQRYIQISINNQEFSFFEAYLTWCTAQLLKEKLEKQGAEVLLTRPSPNADAQKMWQQWNRAKAKLKRNSPQDTLPTFYKWLIGYKKQDFEARYQKINQFKPHLTLIIHYNVDAENLPWEKPTPKNYNMAFVAGSFIGKELHTKKDRFHLLRLLVSQEIERSIDFSDKVLLAFQKHLQVPPIPAEATLDYLQQNCLLTERQGVYARNLTLCREVFGILCYGESLYQDNEQEVVALSQQEIKIAPSILTSKRVAQVAEAYFEAILNYVKNMTVD